MCFLKLVELWVIQFTRIISNYVDCCFQDPETENASFNYVGRQLTCFFFVELKDATEDVFVTEVHHGTDEVNFKIMICLAQVGFNKI